MRNKPMHARLEWRPTVLWVGLSWKAGTPALRYVAGTGEYRRSRRIDVWICLLPCLPFHLWWVQAALP
jgi:hypothetical protein